VLTVYSINIDGFTEDHRRLLEVVARQVSDIVRHAGGSKHFMTAERIDRLKLPRRDRVERFVEAETARSSSQGTVSVVQIHFSATLTDTSQHDAHALEQLAEEISSVLRGADVLCHYGEQDFVVVLTQTDALAVATVAARIANVVAGVCNAHPTIELPTIGVASAPEDGLTLSALLTSADQRRREQVARRSSRPPAIH
jgi:diguanylate cyclase (GGDEF)-like protein